MTPKKGVVDVHVPSAHVDVPPPPPTKESRQFDENNRTEIPTINDNEEESNVMSHEIKMMY